MKNYKLILVAALVALAGCKKDDNPSPPTIYICTAADLDAIRNNLSGNYVLMNDISLADYSDGEGWAPIGAYSDAPFNGKFDGNGHKITNLTINQFNENTNPLISQFYENFVGLFGYISGGSVNDLGVEIAVGEIKGYGYVGSIAGCIGCNSIITNCYSTGNISSSDYAAAFSCSGGIAGCVSMSSITNCYSTGNIFSADSSDYFDAYSYAGGIAGMIEDNCSITNCYSTGNISSSAFSSFSGGIVGSIYNSSIANSYSTGDISSDSDFSHSVFATYSYSGGIAGESQGGSSITTCHSTGDISSDADFSYSGGIVGSIYNSSIANCYSTGGIAANAATDYSDSYSGGIAGHIDNGSLANCYNIGDISSSYSYYFYSGGIAGMIEDRCSIINCYNTGNISSSASSPVSGGIVGGVYNSSIANSYSTGDISSFYSYYSYSGGIAGSVSNSSITNCAAINFTINAGHAGRIVAYGSSGPISNNFATNTMAATGTGQFNTSDLRFYGVSKTDEELQTQSTYSDPPVGDGQGGLGWKFGNDDANPWKMPAGGGYPILYWQ